MNFLIPLGSHPAKPSEGFGSDVPKLCIYGDSGEIFSVHFAKRFVYRNPKGGGAKAKERAQSASIVPKP